MPVIIALAISGCVFALIPAVLFLRNLALYRPLPAVDAICRRCSILIPARNEQENIAEALESVLLSKGIDLEVIVIDDASTDRTAEIVRDMAARDPRVRLETAGPLLEGWCGKSSACHHLAAAARHPLLLFMDADVRVSRPDSIARLAAFLERGGSGLVSGVPREETETLMERLIIPLIHFVLLGFLPLARMRASTDPRLAAACGQIVAVRRDAYFRAGGHAAIAARLHDAVALARLFREHGLATDLFDATDTFECRMYRSATEVWNGFAKNAHEALAAPRLILPATLLLLGGQVLPLLMLWLARTSAEYAFAGLGVVAALLPRLLGMVRFHQPLLGAVLHPLGVTMLIAIQWFAFFRSLGRRPATWKGRSYSTAHAA